MRTLNPMAFGALGAIQIVESIQCCDRKQVRFPKSKKRRIRRKWAKRERNFRITPKIVRMGNQISAHPSLAWNLRHELREAR